MTDTIDNALLSLQDEQVYPDSLPLLPLRDVVLFPDMIIPILVVRESSVEALQEALMQDKYLFLVLQKDSEADFPERDDVHDVGVIARTLQVLKLPNGSAKVLVEGLDRALIRAFNKHDNHIRVEVDVLGNAFDDSPRIKALLRNVINNFSTYVKLSKSIPDEVLINIRQIDEPVRLANTIAAHLLIRNTDKQRILETVEPEEQLNIITGTLAEEIEILELERSIDNEVKERPPQVTERFLPARADAGHQGGTGRGGDRQRDRRTR